LVALLALPCGALRAADDEPPVIEVSPIGVPKNLGSKGSSTRYFLWYDAGGWHLRSDSNDKAHVFTGLIDVVGGKVTSISNFDTLEAGGKKKKADLGILSPDKKQISFKFTTSTARDGFDFRVNEAATAIRFKLMIEGDVKPGHVLIGAASQPAPQKTFALPAHPKE
jgi:hypothetical protein